MKKARFFMFIMVLIMMMVLSACLDSTTAVDKSISLAQVADVNLKDELMRKAPRTYDFMMKLDSLV